MKPSPAAKAFAENDPWIAFRERGLELTVQFLGAVDDGCKVVMSAKGLDETLTVAQAFDTLAADAEHTNLLLWCGLHMWDEMPAAARDAVARAVARDNPIGACLIYMRVPELTDTHDKTLYQGFAEAMPNMREKLARGEAKRAKDQR